MQTPHPFPQIIRVALIDSQEVYRIGLRSLINKHPAFHVVAEFGSMSEALPATPLAADVVLLDSRLAQGPAFELCRLASVPARRSRTLGVLMLNPDAVPLHGDWNAAAGYMVRSLDKSCRGSDILETLQAMVRDASVPGAVSAFPPGRPEPTHHIKTLADTEKSILKLLAEGKTNRDIASALYLSESSIKKHVHKIFRNLGCANRSQAAAYYVLAHAPGSSRKSSPLEPV